MEKYVRQFSEADEDENKEERFDKAVDKIIKTLRDEDFGSEEQRKKFIDLLSSLHNSKDPRARLTFKKLGHHLTEIGDELIKYGQE